MPLNEILQAYHMDVVRAMISRRGLRNVSSKAQAIERLTEWLSDAANVQAAQAGLSSAELSALTRVVELGGSVSATRLEQLLVRDGVVIAPVKESRTGQSIPRAGRIDAEKTLSFADLMAKLAVHGLVFTRTSVVENTQLIKWVPGRYVIIPDFVLANIDRSRLVELPSLLHYDPSYSRSGSVVNAQRDINNYVRTVRRVGSVKLTTAGLVYKTALKQLAEDISASVDLGRGKTEKENGYLFFLRRLLTVQKLVVSNYEHLSAADATHPFWGLDSAERIKALFVAWRDTLAWNGPRMLPSYQRGVELTASAHNELVPARHILLRHIAKLGSGWVSLIGLINSLEVNDYGFLFPERDYEPSYFSYYPYHQSKYQRSPYSQSNNPQFMAFDDTIQDEADGWDRVEAAYIAHVIAGPLYWMGLVDLGYSGPPPADDLAGIKPFDSYRLTPHGEWLLGIGEQPAVEANAGGGIILMPNFEIMAMAPIAVETLMMLDAFAAIKDSQANVTTYELTRDSVYRGQQGRWPVAEIKAFFAQHSRVPMPDNVRRTLDEWDGLYERVTIRRKVSLAETASAEIAQALAQLDDVEQVSERVLVSQKPLREMAHAVRSVGYLPLQTKSGDQSARGSVNITDDGLVTFAHPMPSLFAKRTLTEISVELNDDQRQILPSMVKSHTRGGAYFAEFFGRIKRLHNGELSPTLARNLKAWSNYYGDAQQEQLTLIEFKDRETLNELLAEPDLKEYLTPFRGIRPLAVVSPEHIDLVNDRLATRGIRINQGLQESNS